MKRCKNGTRRCKITGACIDLNDTSENCRRFYECPTGKKKWVYRCSARKQIRAAKATRIAALFRGRRARAALRKTKSESPEGETIEMEVAVSPEQKSTVAKELNDIYSVHYNPPEWSLEMVGGSGWKQMASKVTVFYQTNLEEVKTLVARREPVNIEGLSFNDYNKKNYYDRPIYTGFLNAYCASSVPADYEAPGTKSKSAYSYLSTPDYLPQNFAMYIETPIKQFDEIELISVINCIGYAFDETNQPDLNYFLRKVKGTYAFKADKKAEYMKRLKLIFTFIFACAIRMDKKAIVLSYIGGSAFVKHYPGGEYEYRSVYFKALGEVLKKHKGTIMKLFMMGTAYDYEFNEEFKKLCATHDFACQITEERIPALCFTAQMKKINSTALYVNAWDPHSIVGNGNESDRSLDGFFGRSTAMAYLSLPCINGAIQYEAV